MISPSEVEAALNLLTETDERIAEYEGNVMRLEKRIERVKDRLYLGASGTVAERKAEANKSPEVAILEDEYVSALVAFKSLKAARDTARIKIEMWRTFESSRRAGL